MKRVTVLRMLKKRLHESRRSINVSYDYEDISNVYGSDVSKECSNHREVMKKDIEQLEFLINCLKNQEKVSKVL